MFSKMSLFSTVVPKPPGLLSDDTLLSRMKKLSRFFWCYKNLNLKLFTFFLFQTQNIPWPRCKISVLCPLCLQPPLFRPSTSWHSIPTHPWRQSMPEDWRWSVRENLRTALQTSTLPGVSLSLWDAAGQEMVWKFLPNLIERIPGGMIFH